MKVEFNDGSLELDDNNCLCAIGETAHKHYFRFKELERKGKDIRKMFIACFINLTAVI